MIYLSKQTRYRLFSTWHGLWNLKDLTERSASDEILCDKAFNIAKNLKYDGYQRGLASMIDKFFDKKHLAVVLKMRICQSKNWQKN